MSAVILKLEPQAEGFKKCCRCGLIKAIDEFYRNRRSADRLTYSCSSCQSKAATEWCKNNKEKKRKKRREWALKNPEKTKKSIKNAYLKKRFGIDSKEYNEIFLSQEGKCGICLRHQSEFKISLAVDHCHRTGLIRGLLCSNCNVSLGGFSEDVEIIERAIQYLEKSRCRKL